MSYYKELTLSALHDSLLNLWLNQSDPTMRMRHTLEQTLAEHPESKPEDLLK